MSDRPSRPAERSTGSPVTASRRAFLAATGLAALGATGAGRSVGAPDTGSGRGPGRVRNLPAYLQDPSVFEENREPTHVTAAIPYDSVERAVASDEPLTELEERFDGSPYVRLLNGEWNFRFFERPGDLPDSFGGDGDWDTIPVPRPWQTEGYDERVYTNWQPTWVGYDPELEWELEPDDRGLVDVPGVDDDDPNPVGVYNRTVTVPADWDGREVFLHFEGVKQAYFVWVDDRYVGFQQGSMTPGEFDITEHVSAGQEHELTVQVYRWSDGEALECTDMLKYAGIYRSVYLFSTPRVHLRDFHARPVLDEECEDATLRVDAEIADYSGGAEGEYSVRAALYEPGGGPGAGGPPADAPGRGPPDDARRRGPPAGAAVATCVGSTKVDGEGGVVSLEMAVERPEKWSSERPSLYTLTLELIPAGERSASEAFVEKVGFRRYEAHRGPGGHIAVNGEPVNVRGTNRHETDPDTGRTVPVETVQTDFELLKRFNLNAVRTSHYPNDPTFYRLADEYGVYVQDEVNVETHWWEGVLSHTEAYHEQAVERFRRMVLRDRNHASIFSWSTGNEAGTGAEHLNMAALAIGGDDPTLPADTGDVTRLSGEAVESFDASGIEALAPDRLMSHQPNHGGWDVEYSDMLGPRYVDVDTLVALGAGADVSDSPRFGDRASGDGSPGDGRRSVVMGEYNHAMGNSLGLVDGMWNGYIQPPVRRARDDAGDADGALVGSPEVVPGVEGGGALALDGRADYVDAGRSPDLDFGEPGFTVEVRVAGLDPDADAPLVANGGQYALELRDGEFSFSVAPDSGADADRAVVASAPPEGVDLGDAHALTGVCAADRLRLYLDGDELAAVDHGIDGIGGTDRPFSVGGDAGRGRYLRATVDAVAVHGAALSADGVGAPETPRDDTVLRYSFADLLRDKSLQGGFVWDWVNQDLDDVTADGVEYQFYDRDGPAGAFCLNGMLWSDRRTQPELWQLKQCHQPAKVADRDAASGELYVTNHHQFTNLSELDVTWEVHADDDLVREGTLDLDVPPNATEVVTVDGIRPPGRLEPGAEYRLNVSFALPEATAWAEAGHEVAFAQLELPYDVPDAERPSAASPAVSVDETADGVVVSGDGFEYRFDERLGTLSSMRFGGTELIERGPLFNCWRAPIMNEVQDWGPHPAPTWYDLGLDDLRHRVDAVEVGRAAAGAVDVEVRGRTVGAAEGDATPAGYETTYRYRVFGSGAVTVAVRAEPNDRLVEADAEWLPKVGLQLEAPERFDRFEWYGRGPQETYPDRKRGVRIGRHAGSVDEQYVPYLPPSDNGNKADTRWATLSDGRAGLAAFARSEMNVSLEQWANLDDADYRYELEPRGTVGFNLDHAVTGVGGTPVPPREEYRVTAEPTAFAFTLRPLAGDEDPMELAKRVPLAE